jgi:acetylornithine/succinyldiaminopimelate/putrescine aminotransferase
MERIERFIQSLGQTNQHPFLIDVDYAEGLYIIDKAGKRYADMIAGVAVSSIGHRHPAVVQAIKEQVDRHLHVMVYGEFIQDAQLDMANQLIGLLPNTLDSVYAVNSGTEANEAALKLVKRATGRTELVAFRGSYHGSTHGSLSVSGNETKKMSFRPLLPDVRFLTFNAISDLEHITEKTAGVIIETIQGDAGVRIPEIEFMKALRARCTEVGALLICDEIQCGLGRTGKHFAFQHYDIVPDVLTLGKALGGGMPVGALVASHELLWQFTHNPMLGHITTFGGHPVIAAASAAFLKVLKEEVDLEAVERRGKLLQDLLQQSNEITEVRRKGMMFAFDMASTERVERVVKTCLEKGVLTFWFLSHPYSFRLSPPLTITDEEILTVGQLILDAIHESA